MDFSEKINVEEWKASHPTFDYRDAVSFLSSQQDIDRRNAFLNLSWLARQYVPKTLMKFCSLTDDQDMNLKKLATLERGKIYLSNPSALNDPFDCRGAFYNFENTRNDKKYNEIVEKTISLLPNHISICSFTACSVQSMPMWAHYSNNHKGYCLEYDITDEQNTILRSFVYPVQYSEFRYDISDLLDDQISLSFKRVVDPNGSSRAGKESEPLAQISLFLYNIKHSSWSFEQEYRLSVSSMTQGLPELKSKPSKIYIGVSCSKTNADRLTSIGRAANIPIYKMEYNKRTSAFDLRISQVD